MNERSSLSLSHGVLLLAGVFLAGLAVAGIPQAVSAQANCGLPGLPPCPPPKPRRTPTPVPTDLPTRTPTATPTATATETSTPTATAVPCTTGFLTATLTGADEVPSVNTEGQGTVKLLFDMTAGTITGNWDIIHMSGLITAAHIHSGAAAVNGPVLISLVPLPMGGGTFATLNTAPVANMQQVLANPPAFYVNVHTVVHPGGEIRGQLACAPAQPIASPTASASATPAGVPTGGGGTGSGGSTSPQAGSGGPSPWLLGGLGAIILVCFGGFGLWRMRRGLPGGITDGTKDPGPAGFQKADDQFQKFWSGSGGDQFQKADDQFQKFWSSPGETGGSGGSQFQKADDRFVQQGFNNGEQSGSGGNQFQKADSHFQKADDQFIKGETNPGELDGSGGG